MSEVTYAVADGVATITLAAPERRNALSVEMSRQLIEAARSADGDAAVGAIVVTGGPHFCAGAVRAVLADTGRDPVEDTAYRNLETVYRAFTTIGEAGVPTIAAVRGAAVGAGLNLALATDLRIVSRTARLLPGFAQIGIHPGGGHFTLLNRVAGREAAAAMGLFGEEVDGERAVALGLAWAAHDDADVEREAHAIAARVAGDPELARRLVRSFRRETAPGGVAWDVAVELERSPQMWSLRRKHGPTGGAATADAAV
ncbi:enoyl-CoA hydratase-related protein [Intrasporangium sp.]|uniref:enoyl-CoA hydratase-related protein n=1 Tax=Intrasporangium sp. TaxID=1925024 RepID=UPI00293ADEB9|nr:enoyl-CoA hydratase-related protein [Intrasporangium sp.]MDV3221389.1 enoyl-CoA hydratase-related protein [Intrasporangium sp.]